MTSGVTDRMDDTELEYARSNLFRLGSTLTKTLYVNLDSSDREKFGDVWRGITCLEQVCSIDSVRSVIENDVRSVSILRNYYGIELCIVFAG